MHHVVKATQNDFKARFKSFEPSQDCPSIYPLLEGELIQFHTFPKGINTMWNAISLVQDSTQVALFICNDNDYSTQGLFSAGFEFRVFLLLERLS